MSCKNLCNYFHELNLKIQNFEIAVTKVEKNFATIGGETLMKLLAVIFSILCVTACGTEYETPTTPPTSIIPLTMAELESSTHFNEERTTVISKTECVGALSFVVLVEGKEVSILAEEVAALEHVFRVLEISKDNVLACGQ